MTSLFLILISIVTWAAPVIHGQVLISELHPTQGAIGYLEVENRKEKVKEKSDKELEEYLQKKVVPVVIGPKGRFYILDHHHLARVLHELGHKYMYFSVYADWSDTGISETEFWQKMKDEKFVYLKNQNGDPISEKDLPKSVAQMTDDKYRSLAWKVKEWGGFIKTTKLYFEFIWADFFRTRIKFENSKKGIKEIKEEVLALAQSAEAKELPGYIGNGRRCGSLLHK
jgi:hypothetical protein